MKIDRNAVDKFALGFMGSAIAVCLGLAAVAGAGWLLVFAGKAFFKILGVM